MTGTSHHIDMRVQDFLAFLDGRPDEERWELIEGMPIMMTPPLIAHQRIASNLEQALNKAIAARGLDRRADREIGLQIESAPGYRPEPEVTVIDADYEHDRYASRFYGVVEVLSATDHARNPRTGRVVIEDKIAFYRSHPFAEFLLVVEQDRMALTLHRRDAEGGWTEARIDDPSEAIVLPELGSIGTLAEAYRGVRFPNAS